MFIEILITIVLLTTAAYILYKNIRKKGTGGCDCGSCSTHCPSYAKEHSKDEKDPDTKK